MASSNEQFLEIELPAHNLRVPVHRDDTIENIRDKALKGVKPEHPDYELLESGLGAKVFPILPPKLYKYTPLKDSLEATQCIGYKLVSTAAVEVPVLIFDARTNEIDPTRHEFRIGISPSRTLAFARQKIYQEMLKQNIIGSQVPIEDLRMASGIVLDNLDVPLGAMGVHNGSALVLTVLLGNTDIRVFNFKTLTGKNIPVAVTAAGRTVWDLKLIIQEKEGIPPDQQRLVVKPGRQLRDDDPVDSLAYGETLYLVLRLRGGGEGSIGLSTGGAKDVALFRKKIASGTVPQLSDLTYEGLFYEYNFDTGNSSAENANTNKLFYPVYAQAVCTNPLTGQQEHYLKVGLNSNMKQNEFSRKQLRLCIVLDISGSMSSPFDPYFTDPVTGAKREVPAQERGFSKLNVALQTIVNLLDFLNDDDYLSLVLFDDDSYIAYPMQKVKVASFPLLKQAIMTLNTLGSTNFSKGMEQGTKEFAQFSKDSNEVLSQYEHRIIYLTDAIPNMGTTDATSLLKMVNENAVGLKHNVHIHSTFIGIGVDFDTKLIEAITKVRGSNYFSVHSSREFKERLQENFEFLVSPLVFDLKLKLEGKGVSIEEVYGTPEADQTTSDIMKVSTLFPSKREDNGEARGGVILLKLKYDPKKFKDNQVTLQVSYEEARTGIQSKEEQHVSLIDPAVQEHFDDTVAKKAVALVQYARFLKNWMKNQKDYRWSVSSSEKASAQRLIAMMEKVMKEVEDDTLSKEVTIL
eukprot:CAMPEP_0168553062 /NCGR_PEP_ID=MMETSP0413-20121227/7050_1 /TAXON_ID=136452 /ORGANISM="Filamoeba nolandi, Strain NC-AS-23-1" /LENGTH=744 /DNA_ID=CAMNT_0008583719 /DNA_START=144 /DNA_END=2375 /DNA_ORIENTATION=+